MKDTTKTRKQPLCRGPSRLLRRDCCSKNDNNLETRINNNSSSESDFPNEETFDEGKINSDINLKLRLLSSTEKVNGNKIKILVSAGSRSSSNVYKELLNIPKKFENPKINLLVALKQRFTKVSREHLKLSKICDHSYQVESRAEKSEQRNQIKKL